LSILLKLLLRGNGLVFEPKLKLRTIFLCHILFLPHNCVSFYSSEADYSGLKRFMQFFTYLVVVLYGTFFTGENIEYGIACSILASIGYVGSLVSTMVFYQRFLPANEWTRVSARRFAMGYTGGIIFIDYQFAVVSKHAVFGFESASSAT
jgi:UMF1 family MFS transporter